MQKCRVELPARAMLRLESKRYAKRGRKMLIATEKKLLKVIVTLNNVKPWCGRYWCWRSVHLNREI